MKHININLVVLIMLLTISISGCSKTETSESLKEKYGLAPLGVEACDTYLNKLRNCLDKAPSKNHSSIVDLYTFILSDMENLAKDKNPEAQKMVVEACNMGDSANRSAMEAMGCDWSDNEEPVLEAKKPRETAAMAPELIEFTADRRAVRLSAQLADSDKATVTVEANAIIYDPPLVIPDITKYKLALDPDVQFIVHYHQTCATSKPENITAMWHSAERGGKKELLQREGVFAAMKKYYQSNKSLEILGIVFQTNTKSVLVRLDGAALGFHIIEENGEPKLTDNPDDDLELAIIEASYVKNQGR